MSKASTFTEMFPGQAPAEIEAAKSVEQAKRDFNNLLESRRSEVDFLVEHGEPFFDGSEDSKS